MNINHIHNIYFIGIGGIGMSALARYFISCGKNVSGYDKTSTKLTKELEVLSASIHYEDDLDIIDDCYFNKEQTLVVYTPAIPDIHKELSYFKKEKFTVLKRAEVLGLITKNTFCYAVAGTHGKTTTSSILGHLLKVCDAKMTAFLGGITENYHSNLIENGSEISVVEADEYDRSFLKLSPNIACITSVDADHLDIYGKPDELIKSFDDFANLIDEESNLFVCYGIDMKGITYGFNDKADYSIQNLNIINGTYNFSIKTPKEIIENVEFNLPGRHNISNALVAFAMAYANGYNKNDLLGGLKSFKGVERRFSYVHKSKNKIIIDDYAHHPTEINSVYNAVKEMYPDDSVLTIFQPHLYSRTRDFIDNFAESLSQFNQVRLLDIYPAREIPIDGVNSEWLLSKITNVDKKIISKSDINSEVEKSKSRIILFIGAGDIGEEVNNLKKNLQFEN